MNYPGFFLNFSEFSKKIFQEKCQNLNAKVELKKRKFEDDLEDRINVLKDHNDSLHKKSLDTIKNFKSLIIEFVISFFS